MRIASLVASILLLVSCAPQSTYADVLVDSGPFSELHHYISLYDERPAQQFFQYVAGQFTLNQSFNISSVEGYMIPPHGGVVLKLYRDAAGLSGNQLFSDTFQFPPSSDPLWEVAGPALNWSAPAGTYWLSFEPTAGSDFGSMPGVVAHPLAAYATLSNNARSWTRADNIQVGFRVNGTFVPEPSGCALAFIAIGAVVAASRRRTLPGRAA
jgi:hypothetical protein